MTDTPETEKNLNLTRRKALSRLGIASLVAYAGPAMSTLSMAQAASSASAPSKASKPSKASDPTKPSEASEPSDASKPSDPSVASEPSTPSVASTPSGPDSDDDDAAFKACGPKDLNDPEYVACLVKNGLPTT